MKFADAFADERESLETISRDAAAPAAADRPRKKTGDQVAPQFGRFYRRGLNCGGADEDDRCRWSHGALSHVIGRIRSRTRGQCGVRRFVGGRRVGTRRSGRRCGDRLHRGACDRPIVGVATVRTERPGATVEVDLRHQMWAVVRRMARRERRVPHRVPTAKQRAQQTRLSRPDRLRNPRALCHRPACRDSSERPKRGWRLSPRAHPLRAFSIAVSERSLARA